MAPKTRITAATMPNVRLTMIVIKTGGDAAGPHYDYEYVPAQPAAGTLPVSPKPAPARAALLLERAGHRCLHLGLPVLRSVRRIRADRHA